MNKIFKLTAFLVLLAATGAYAQEDLFYIGFMEPAFVRGDEFQNQARPYRDRAERFSSARLDALQMRLAIGDEADQLTLENWGDNRADIRASSRTVKAEYSALGGTTYDSEGNKMEDYPGWLGGVYAHYDRLQAEVSHLERRGEKPGSGSGPDESFNIKGAGAAWSSGGESLRWGLHGNYNLANYNVDSMDTKDVDMRNSTAGGGAAMRLGVLDLGVTADYVDRSYSAGTAYVARRGSLLGAQGIINPFGGLKLGLRYSYASISPGAQKTWTYQHQNEAQFGARGEWAFNAVPLTVAASFDNARLGYEKDSLISMKNTLASAGAALRPFGGRVLIGAEAKNFSSHYREDAPGYYIDWNIHRTAYTGGAEVWLLPGLAVRGSYQRQLMTVDDFRIWYNIKAFGAGLKLGSSTFDVSYTRQALNNAKSGWFSEGKLMYGYMF